MELTTKAQEAFSTAVRAATAAGHPHVEPAHLLAALAQQPDTTTGALLESVGSSADPGRRRLAAKALASPAGRERQHRLPAAAGPRHPHGAAAGPAGHDRDGRHLHLDRPPAARAGPDRRAFGLDADAIIDPDPRAARRPQGHDREPEASVRRAREVRRRPHRGSPGRQARPGHRPRQRDPPGHPGAVASDQEQPGADRRARRRQDRRRRGPGPADRGRRRARVVAGQAVDVTRPGRDGGRRQVPR